MATHHDAGVEVTCPGCGLTVLQKGMIPVLAGVAPGFSYLCVACARAAIVPATVPGTGPAADVTSDDDHGTDVAG
jgi:DNA-directed RNA polymerase subunit RPC12/RpoP